MDTYHLSKRLAKAAAYVPKGARLADIGSDHAYLPANLAINHIIDYGVAGEVVKGPYEDGKEIGRLVNKDRMKMQFTKSSVSIWKKKFFRALLMD